MYSGLIILSLVAFLNAAPLAPEHRSLNQGTNLTPNNVYLPPATPSTSAVVSPSTVNTYTTHSTVVNTQTPTRQVAIVRQANENSGDGSFGFSYETEDGQTAEARGQLQTDGAEGAQSTQGFYSYTGDDGVRYTVSYTAGVNGFVAEGAHLPVAPPVPEAIAKALAENAADEARGIFDDGSYREDTTVGQINYQHQQGVQTVQTNYHQGVKTTSQQGVQTGYQQVQVSGQGVHLGVPTTYQQVHVGNQQGVQTVQTSYPQSVQTGYQHVVHRVAQPVVQTGSQGVQTVYQQVQGAQTGYQQGVQTVSQGVQTGYQQGVQTVSQGVQTGYQQGVQTSSQGVQAVYQQVHGVQTGNQQGVQTGSQYGVHTGHQQVQQGVQTNTAGVQTVYQQAVPTVAQQVVRTGNQQVVQSVNQSGVQTGYQQVTHSANQQGVQTGYQRIVPSRPFNF